MKRSGIFAIAVLAASSVLLGGCTKTGADGDKIANVGSETLLQLGMAWSETYKKEAPGVKIEVSGGGSGVGIAGLVNGSVDLANSSKSIDEKERADVLAKQGKEVKEFIVGYDALSIFVHKNNPLNEITIEELAEIYKEGGKIRKWSDLGVTNITGAKGDKIIVLSRQSNSGTHSYFRDAVIGKKTMERLDKINQNGSADVVNLIATTENAIGYAGMGFANDRVKTLKVAKKKGGSYIVPSVASTLDKTYPIARPMFVLTAGEPKPSVRSYIDFILGPKGQELLRAQGYVPNQTK